MPSSVSIVVITRDRARVLGRVLERLVALPGAHEVIVVDNGSSDDTPRVARQSGAQCIVLPWNAGAAGRNVGVEAAATPYVAFSDDDSWWAPGALERAEAILSSEPRLGLLQGRILVGRDDRLDPMCRGLAPGAAIDGFLACGAVVRREAFLEAGGFHARYGVGGEEALLAIDLVRRGWRLEYHPRVVAHHHPSSRGERPGRRARMVRNDLWTAWLRRDAGEALAFTGRVLKESVKDREARRGLVAAARGLGWVLRERRP